MGWAKVGSKYLTEDRRCLFELRVGRVRVDGERRAHVAVAELVRDDPRRHAAREQRRGDAVPCGVKRDGR
jgi:hypothetical protein